jgi:hypothetical protein
MDQNGPAERITRQMQPAREFLVREAPPERAHKAQRGRAISAEIT